MVVPITDSGEVPVEEFEKRLSERTRIAAVSHVSNALGTINPVEEFVRLAHERNVPVLVDGAQAAPHLPIDVAALGCDFYAVSGHKMYGPTGIGALYGTEAWLEKLPPYQGGGDMIASVTFEKTTYNELPWKFEAGTANIAGGIVFGVATDWLTAVGLPAVAAHEHGLLVRATEALSAIEGLRIVGTAPKKAAVVSFLLGDVHPHDIGTVLDREGIAIRTGQHCAQPRHGPLRDRRDRARLLRRLQHGGRGRHPRRGPEEGAGGLRLMTDLRDLYQEVILDHNKSPHNYREMADREPHGARPQPALRRPAEALREARRRQDRGRRVPGPGCAISKASASLMTDAVKGKTIAEAEALYGKFHDLLTGPPDVKATGAGLGKLAVFSGVREFPVRVKCATLAWHTLESALKDVHEVAKTE